MKFLSRILYSRINSRLNRSPFRRACALLVFLLIKIHIFVILHMFSVCASRHQVQGQVATVWHSHQLLSSQPFLYGIRFLLTSEIKSLAILPLGILAFQLTLDRADCVVFLWSCWHRLIVGINEGSWTDNMIQISPISHTCIYFATFIIFTVILDSFCLVYVGIWIGVLLWIKLGISRE